MSFRKITLDSGVWKWKVGHSYVCLISPEGKRTNHAVSKVLGHPQSDEPDQTFPITPESIKKYVAKLTS